MCWLALPLFSLILLPLRCRNLLMGWMNRHREDELGESAALAEQIRSNPWLSH